MQGRKIVRCPQCDSATNIVDSRKYHDPKELFDFVSRRRLCKSCNQKFITIEVTEDTWINILNQSTGTNRNEQ